ncbi:MAG: acyl dehydratase [Actinomycetia bacterium]|nr:acyl dehydratase [Actinomycetes bacterium]MCP4221778.1 acyl dehydratase [Actinomycetes bacterium]MCP5032692.1 acyl dehydratase [Actinomycetes bacterium]
MTMADVAVGHELPVMTKNASRAQLFLYSAASFNPHRIHYDRDYAAVEGHPDVLVHGPLQGSWLTQYLTDWIGPRGRLRSVTWQNRVSAFPEQDLEFHGRVNAVDPETGEVELEVWEQTADGTVLMPGSAIVVLPTGL